jgi:hypothetical protein
MPTDPERLSSYDGALRDADDQAPRPLHVAMAGTSVSGLKLLVYQALSY